MLHSLISHEPSTRYAAVLTASAASVLLAAATQAAPLSYEAAVLEDNPYAYYRFGETSGTVAADSSGNTRNAVYTDSPTLGVAGYGTASDTAVSFDTGGDYVSFPTSDFTALGPALSHYSLEFVVSTTTSATSTLMGVFNDGSNTGMLIQLNSNLTGTSTTSNGLRFFMRAESGEQLEAFVSMPTLFDGDYHHLAFTYDVGNLPSIYLDGVQQTITGSNNAIDLTGDSFKLDEYDLVLGGSNSRGSYSVATVATVDELAFYNRVLTGEELAGHSNALVPEPGSLALLMAGGLMLTVRRKTAG